MDKRYHNYILLVELKMNLYQGNIDFVNYLDEKGIHINLKSARYHDYAFWDKAIEDVIDRFTSSHKRMLEYS